MTNDELDRLAAVKLDVIAHETYDVKRFGYIDGNGSAWQPTRNIAQAWECLDKANGFEVSIGGSFLGWRCNIYSQKEFEEDFGPGGHGKAIFEYCDSAPLAIVRACLKAKGIEV